MRTCDEKLSCCPLIPCYNHTFVLVGQLLLWLSLWKLVVNQTFYCLWCWGCCIFCCLILYVGVNCCRWHCCLLFHNRLIFFYILGVLSGLYGLFHLLLPCFHPEVSCVGDVVIFRISKFSSKSVIMRKWKMWRMEMFERYKYLMREESSRISKVQVSLDEGYL